MKTVTRNNIERKIGSVKVARRNADAQNARYDKAARVLHNIPFGQPVIAGRRNFYEPLTDAMESAARQGAEWEATAENREELHAKVETMLLKGVQDVAVTGKSAYASVGVRTSINNLDYFRCELAELEQSAIDAKRINRENAAKIKGMTAGEIRAAGLENLMIDCWFRDRPDDSVPPVYMLKKYDTQSAKIKDRKEKIARLEKMAKVTENAKENDILTEYLADGTLSQWQKQPIYYFVCGMRKTAVMQTSDGFALSRKYYPSPDDLDAVQKIIDRLNA